MTPKSEGEILILMLSNLKAILTFPTFFFFWRGGTSVQFGPLLGVLQGYSWLSAQVLPLVVMQWQGSELVSVLNEDTPCTIHSPVGKI